MVRFLRAVFHLLGAMCEAECELWEVHWRHFRHGEGYSDASHAIAKRKMGW